MEITNDLKRILWHEIGHFCIDLLDSASNPDFQIDSFVVSYHENAISYHKWAGRVKTLPGLKFGELIKDNDKTSFAILSLISGCSFQTIFLKEFLKCNIIFCRCFCKQDKCVGQDDNYKFYDILSRLRNKYIENERLMKFLELELFDAFYSLIVKNQEFLNKINELVIIFSDKIFDVYQQSGNKDEFHYPFDENELQILKEEVSIIMTESLFKEEAINFKEKIKEKMLA